MSIGSSRALAGRFRSFAREFLITAAGIGFAVLLGAILIRLAGASPETAYLELLRGGFGTIRNLAETLLRFCPLALCALAVGVGFRASFFTIGMQGQFYFGALAATVTGLWLGSLPAWLLIPLCLGAGVVAGAAWALVAGFLRVRLGVSEVISTIMLNYIAGLVVDYLLRGPLQAPGSELQYTAVISAAAWFPRLLAGSRLTWGILVPLGGAIAVHLVMERTGVGFRMKAAGANPLAAAYGGINGARSLLAAAAVSGALAGAAGALEIQGVYHRLQGGIAADYGFTAIPVALVGNTLPGPTLVAAVLFAALDVGATMMQLKAAVPLPLVKILQGLIVLCVVGARAVPGLGPIRWFRKRGSETP